MVCSFFLFSLSPTPINAIVGLYKKLVNWRTRLDQTKPVCSVRCKTGIGLVPIHIFSYRLETGLVLVLIKFASNLTKSDWFTTN